jgi:hypothetical protein
VKQPWLESIVYENLSLRILVPSYIRYSTNFRPCANRKRLDQLELTGWLLESESRAVVNVPAAIFPILDAFSSGSDFTFFRVGIAEEMAAAGIFVSLRNRKATARAALTNRSTLPPPPLHSSPSNVEESAVNPRATSASASDSRRRPQRVSPTATNGQRAGCSRAAASYSSGEMTRIVVVICGDIGGCLSIKSSENQKGRLLIEIWREESPFR